MFRVICVLLLLSMQMEMDTKANMVETNKPYSYEILIQDLNKIQDRYKQEVKINKIGTTHFGRDILAVKLGKGKKNIVFIGSHHAREWLTSMLLMKMLENYADAYKKGEKIGPYSTDIFNEVSIWFVPMLNPDGVTIQQKTLHTYSSKQQERLRKMNKGSDNFERWKANGMGVDLNRQYPAGWASLKRKPNGPYYKFYKGKKPFEAKEVRVLTNFIREINPSLAVAYHTAGREIFWNYNNGINRNRDRNIAKKIAKLTGYKLGKPPKQAVGGGFTDWFITTFHRPAMTIEISYLVGETSPPLSVFETEWNRNKYVGLKLAAEAKSLFN